MFDVACDFYRCPAAVVRHRHFTFHCFRLRRCLFSRRRITFRTQPLFHPCLLRQCCRSTASPDYCFRHISRRWTVPPVSWSTPQDFWARWRPTCRRLPAALTESPHPPPHVCLTKPIYSVWPKKKVLSKCRFSILADFLTQMPFTLSRSWSINCTTGFISRGNAPWLYKMSFVVPQSRLFYNLFFHLKSYNTYL